MDVKSLWLSGKERRATVKALLDVYENDWEDQLLAELKARFRPENYDHLHLVADISLNLMRWAVDKLAKIYAMPATRTLVEGDSNEAWERYNQKSCLDLTLLEACRLTLLCREVLIRPVVLSGVLGFDVVTPDLCEVIPRPEDPTQIQTVIHQIQRYNAVSDRTEPALAVWTDSTYEVYDSAYQRVPVEGNENGVNPYKVVPFVACHARWPVGSFWHEQESQALKRATLEAAVSMTNLRHLQQVASFKQPVLSGKPGKDFSLHAVMDPTQPVLLGENGKADVLDLRADLQEQMEVIVQQMDVILNTYGIKADAFRKEVVASSGYALQIRQQDLEEVWNEQRRLWDVWEDDLYQKTRIVSSVEGWGELPIGPYRITWPEVGTRQNPQEVLTYWDTRLKAGLSRRVDAIMALDNLSEEEALERVQQIDAERALLSPLPMMPPVEEEAPTDEDLEEDSDATEEIA